MTIAAVILYALASGNASTVDPAVLPGAAQPPVAQQTTPATPTPQTQPDPDQDVPTGVASADAYDLGTLTVTAAKPRGSVQGDIPPDIVLDTEQLKAYGASNIAELLTAIEPLTRSSRGRSDAGPVVLLNGRRTTGFQEIRGIPFEAIERTEILPEEVALTYGYSADQRVVNIVLRDTFRQGSVAIQTRGPAQGGRLTSEIDGNFFRIQGADRWNLDLEYERADALFESDRDIVRDPGSQPFDLTGNLRGVPNGAEIDPALSALVGSPVTAAALPVGVTSPTLADLAAGAGQTRTGNLGDYRTLLPRTESSQMRASVARDLNSSTQGTLSLSLEDSSSQSLLGLPGLTLTVPGSNPFSPLTNDALLYRYVDAPDVMTRDSDSLTANLGLMLNGFLGDWRWTFNGSYDRAESDSTTGRGFNASAWQADINAGANPFGDIPLNRLTALQDTSKSVSSGGTAEVILSGRPVTLPAGGIQTTLKAGFDTRSLESESVRSGVFNSGDLSRDRGYVTGNFSLPIANRSREVLTALGDLSVNVNAGYEELSDFGGLTTFGAGVNWSPIEMLGLNASYTNEQGAPTVAQLNNPVVTTPNVAVYDFVTGDTVNITQISGGNRNLESDNREVLKVGFNLRPLSSQDLSISSNYTWSRTEDDIVSFPTITPDLEAALPERFTRDAAGNLVSIDARPLNYERSERQDLRTGFNFSMPWGKPNAQAAAGRGPGGGGPVMIMGGPPPGGGGQFRGGGGRGRGPQMQPGQGRFNVSVYHTYRFQDEIVIRDGLPIIDQLNGGSTSARGVSRQEIQLQAGVFRNGFGGFMNANWREGTRINGATSAQDISFGDQTTVNLNVFMDLNARTSWVEKFPILKGARVNLGVENLFDSRVDVRSSGDLPLNYQPDFLDPQGRVVRISLRKILF
ncbi:TonB-dependent receptor [Brevundimonas sp. VNH65]|uniref:TonB-dependent receptor n=1 Tax=Brevundimonas sp. VNH65 TaxID=3400917 RepID=UPI003C04C2A9